MQRILVATLGLLMTIMGSVALAQDSRPKPAEPWKVGAMVPDVTLKGSDGKEYRLRDFVGKQAVVIAWFPKSFTGG